MAWFGLRRSRKPSDQAVIDALKGLSLLIEKKNIPVIADDWDAGYDLAIDEVLALINDTINQIASDNDVDYSGGF